MYKLLCFLALSLPLYATGWSVNGGSWQHKYTIAAKSKYVQENGTYQVSINLDDPRFDTLRSQARQDGHDIFFSLDGSTKTNHFLAYSNLGHSAKMCATLSTSTWTPIYVFVGNASSVDQSSSTLQCDSHTVADYVWKDGSLTDITGSGITATPHGTITTTTGPQGTHALVFNGVDSYLTAPAPSVSSYTWTVWVKPDMIPAYSGDSIYRAVFTAGGALWLWNCPAAWNYVNGNFSMNYVAMTNVWQQGAATSDGSSTIAYFDGGQTNSGAAAGFSGTINIGGDSGANKWRGAIGEYTVHNIARSRQWIATAYQFQIHPDVAFDVSAADDGGATTPVIDNFSATYAYILSGGHSDLEWLVRGATSVTIDQSVGLQATLVAGTVPVNPTSTKTYTLTACNGGNCVSSTPVTVKVIAAPYAFVRIGGPQGAWGCPWGGYVQNGTTTEICSTIADGFVKGDLVLLEYFVSNDAAVHHATNIRGVFQVRQQLDTHHFLIEGRDGSNVVPNAPWSAGYGYAGQRPETQIARVTPYAINDNPMLHGSLNGESSQKLYAHPISFNCTGSPSTKCVVTLQYALDIKIGDVVAVRNSGNSTLSAASTGSEFTVLGGADAPTTYTYTISAPNVPNGDYTHANDHCGPSAGNPHIIGGTLQCLTVSQTAISTNAEWIHILSITPSSSAAYTHIWDGGTSTAEGQDGQQISTMVVRFLVDPTYQFALDGMVYWANHIERLWGVGFWVAPPEIAGNGGTNDAQFFNNVISQFLTLPEAVIDYLSSGEQTAFLGKMNNSFEDPADQCDDQIVGVGPGTVTISGTTITGDSNTTFLTTFHVGDGIMSAGHIAAGWNKPEWAPSTTYAAGDLVMYNGGLSVSKSGGNTNHPPTDGNWWSQPFEEGYTGAPRTVYYVAAITDDHHMTVKLAPQVRFDGSSAVYYIIPGYTYTQSLHGKACGFRRLHGLATGPGAMYVNSYGGNLSYVNSMPIFQDNHYGTFLSLGMQLYCGMVKYDARLIQDCSSHQEKIIDYPIRYALMSWTPLADDGCHYGIGNTQTFWAALKKILDIFPDYPKISIPLTAGNWQIFKMFSPPDKFGGSLHKQMFGSNNGNCSWHDNNDNTAANDMVGSDLGMMFPEYQQTVTGKRFINFLNVQQFDIAHQNTGYTGSWLTDYRPSLWSEGTDYTAAPTQYYFTVTDSRPACELLSGATQDWGCKWLSHDGVISRGPWKVSGQENRSATQVFVNDSTFWYEYTNPLINSIMISKTGILSYMDSFNPSGDTEWSTGTPDPMVRGDIPDFGGSIGIRGGPGNGGIDVGPAKKAAWGSAANGYYGDPQSRYMLFVAENNGTLSPTVDSWKRSVVHFKTGKELVVRGDYTKTTSIGKKPVRNGFFFAQSGDPQGIESYREGNTTCCTSGNVVHSHESGDPADSVGPGRTAGLLTTAYGSGMDGSTPVGSTFTWNGMSYPAASGKNYRASLAAAADVTEFHSLWVSKVVPDFSTDDALNITELVPSWDWRGFNGEGHNYLESMTGLQSSIPAITTVAGDALYYGVLAGTYTASGSATGTFTVVDGDNSIYVPTVSSGTLVFNGVAPAFSITTTTLPKGTTTIPYSQAIATANGTAPLTWAVSAGSLCAGLSLGPSTGIVSGTPTTAQTCSFTARATDAGLNTASRTFSITIDSSVSNTLPGPGSCQLFPSTAVWNRIVTDLSVTSDSSTLVGSIGSALHLRYDTGIPIANVPHSQSLVGITIQNPAESDPGPWPIPPDAPVETGGTDYHVIIVDRDNCIDYEMFGASLDVNGSTWTASSTAHWDMTVNTLRTDGWTSTDAAGLPILPFLVRYEEIAGGIHHALRFTAASTRNTYVWPARHYAGTNNVNLPPMGQRFRLKSSFVISGFGPQATAILQALKTYGMVLADNGQAWGMQLAFDPQSRWNTSGDLDQLLTVLGNNFEAIDESGIVVNPNSAQATQPTAPISGKTTRGITPRGIVIR